MWKMWRRLLIAIHRKIKYTGRPVFKVSILFTVNQLILFQYDRKVIINACNDPGIYSSPY